MIENRRLLHIVIFHSVFASFGDIQANVINFLAVPIRNFFGQSLKLHYGVEPNSQRFEFLYSAIASSFFVGVFFGGITMAFCLERFGRKGTAVYIRSSLGILSALAMLMAKWFLSAEFFVIGHFLAGVLCTQRVALSIYMAECAPDHSRGLCATGLGSGSSLVLLLVSSLCLPALFGNDRDWWLLPAICLLLAMCHLFVSAYFPESPKHLFIGMGQKEMAKEAVQFYHGHSANFASIFEEYEAEKLVVHREKIGIREFWTSRRLRWSMALTLLASLLPALSLASLKSQYLESMLMRYGMGQSSAIVATMVMTAFGTPFSLMAPFLIERIGRRPLFLAVTALSIMELAMVFGAQAIFDALDGGGWMVAGIALFGCTLGQLSCSLGIFNMNPMLVAELFPHQARALATQMSQMPPMLLVLGVVLAYPSAISRIGCLFLLPLFLFSLLFGALMWKWLPETKGLPVDEIFRRLAESNSSTPKTSTSSIREYGSMEERQCGGETSKMMP